jgi:S-adenosylmethionine:tRNA ribosyltransferase-isomerase
MDVSAFDFHLPSDLIAQEPASNREEARLLVLSEGGAGPLHTRVAMLPTLLKPGDLVVVNDTKVFPARLLGRRVPSGGKVECLLIGRLRQETDGESGGEVWEALMHPGQKLKPGARVVFEGSSTIHGEIVERRFHGRRVVRLWTEARAALDDAIDAIGHVPQPPYIVRPDRPSDRGWYQTVFAEHLGSVAAPTAGLHFTDHLVDELTARGVRIARVTLHVGYGTFQPVRTATVEEHRVEAEHYQVSVEAATAINAALDEGRRVIAVGTTTTRVLEAVGRANQGRMVAGGGTTDLFIFPGHVFRIVRGLLTNFHLPRSSLLMLVAALGGRERVLAAYATAVAERYRFYSYGDAMLIL